MGRLEAVATKHDLYFALALTVRDRLFHRSVASIKNYGGAGARRVATCLSDRSHSQRSTRNWRHYGFLRSRRENNLYPHYITSLDNLIPSAVRARPSMCTRTAARPGS
jgi:hypothetical protein